MSILKSDTGILKLCVTSCMVNVLLMLCICQDTFSQGFELTFGGQGTQVCYDIVMDSDSNIYLLGYDDSGTIGNHDFMLSKVSASGQHLWTHHFGTTENDIGYSLFYKTNSTLVLAGTTYDTLLGAQAMLIVTDTSGAEISRYTYGTIDTENICAATAAPDGGYILCGYQSVSGINNTYVLKIDSLFNEEWWVVYGAGINDYANETIMTDDSTCYVAADRRINLGGGNLDYDINILKLNGTGQLIRDSVYTAPFQNGGQGLFQDQSGNIVFFGETEIYQFSPFDYFISAVNAQGELLWSYTFGGSGTNALFDVLQDGSGNYIGTGYGNTESNGIDPLNLTILKIDSLGNLAWEREYGYSGIDIGYAIIDAGNGYLAGGRATTADGDDFYLIKTDWNGFTGQEEIGDQPPVTLFPNPCHDELHITSANPFHAVIVYDVVGRNVLQIPADPYSDNVLNLNVSRLTPGVYFAEIPGSGNKTIRLPFIKTDR